MRNLPLVCAVVALAIAAGGPAWAAPPPEVWVAPPPAGDDANPGTEAAPFATIQKALDTVAEGGTVHVGEGTYAEAGQIVIGRNVTVSGDAANKPVIKPAQDTGASGDARGWWLVQAGANLNLQNVVLDGEAHNVYQAVRAFGTGTLHNCDLRNIVFPPYEGTGIVFVNANWTVTGNTFETIGRIGVFAFGSGVTDAVIAGNIYTGKGPIDCLDYGVELGGGAAAALAGNTITNCKGIAFVDGSVSAAVLITTYYGGVSTAVLVANSLTDNWIGVAVGYDENDLSVVAANNNNLSGNGVYGIHSTAPAVNATSNWWGSYAGPGATDGGGRTGDAVSANVNTDPYTLGQYGVDSDADATDDDADADDDDDGFTDAFEADRGSDPLDPTSAPVTFDLAGDIHAPGSPCASPQLGDWIQVGPLGPNGSFDWGTLDNYSAPPFMPPLTADDIDRYGWAMEGALDNMSGSTLTYIGEFWICPYGYGFDTKDRAIEHGAVTLVVDTSAGRATGVFIADEGTLQPPGWPAPTDFDLANPGVFEGTFDCNGNALDGTVTGVTDLSDANLLALNVADVYARPGETVTVTLDVSNLVQEVNGCQAVIGYDDGHLALSEITAGDAVWSMLIYPYDLGWLLPGEIDVAVGVADPSGAVATEADGMVAVFKLTAAAEGQTYLWFRPDISEIESTLLADMTASPIEPAKADSPIIYIDGISPTITQLEAHPATWTNADEVVISFAATDDNAGISTYELSVEGVDAGAFFEAASPYALNVSGLPDGEPQVTLRVTDNAGNQATASINLQLDGTAPLAFTPTADPGWWTNAAIIIIEFSTTDETSGVDHYELSVDGGERTTETSPYALSTDGFSDGTHAVEVTAVDRAGNERTGSVTVYFDQTPPNIQIISVTQEGGTRDLLAGDAAILGVVTIMVKVCEATSSLAGIPIVTIAYNPTDEAEFVCGVFEYAWEVTLAVPNGPATIGATVWDNAGNSASDTVMIYINTRQITGEVELESLVGGITRTVTFAVTHPSGTQTIDVDVAFPAGSSVGPYRIVALPADLSAVSAKTAWNLRRRRPASLDENGQGAVNFAGVDHMLPGGDLNDTNAINILDYSVMKNSWYTTEAVADINGDGEVNVLDYAIMKHNWLRKGEDE